MRSYFPRGIIVQLFSKYRTGTPRRSIRVRLRSQKAGYFEEQMVIKTTHSTREVYNMMLLLIDARNRYAQDYCPDFYDEIKDEPKMSIEEFEAAIRQLHIDNANGVDWVGTRNMNRLEAELETEVIPRIRREAASYIESPAVAVAREQVRSVLSRYGLA
jgi:hypothetical protein